MKRIKFIILGVLTFALSLLLIPKTYAAGLKADLWNYLDGEHTISINQSHIQTSGYSDNEYTGYPFYLALNDYSTDSCYQVSGKFYNTESNPMELQDTGTVGMGIVPYYIDDNNFIVIYMKWINENSSTAMANVHCNIKYNGVWKDVVLRWIYDNNNYSALHKNSNDINGFNLITKVYSTYIDVYVNDLKIGTLDTTSYFSALTNKSSLIGLYSWWSSTKVENFSASKLDTTVYYPESEYLEYGDTKYQEGVGSVDITTDNQEAIDSYIEDNNYHSDNEYLEYGDTKYQEGVGSVDTESHFNNGYDVGYDEGVNVGLSNSDNNVYYGAFIGLLVVVLIAWFIKFIKRR